MTSASSVCAAISASQVTRRFSALVALDRFSFQVKPGELYGLVGPDGAGKTTATRVVAGLMLPDAGIVRVFGEPPTRANVRERLGLMPQQFSLYRDLSVRENLEFFARLNALPHRVFHKRAERLLAITRLAPFLERRADALSGGMYKKLALACALLHEPDALLLDEPTNGVDPVSRRELWVLLHEFVESGMAVLISTPYMDEAERCHRVGLLHRGRLLLEGQPRALLQGFENEAYEVIGPDREGAEAALGGQSWVDSLSPAGSRLRVVTAARARGRLDAALEPLGARAVPVAPTFEDVYLARLAQEAA